MGLVQDLLVVSSRRRDDELIRDDRESAFGSGCALEHGLGPLLELVDALGQVFSLLTGSVTVTKEIAS